MSEQSAKILEAVNEMRDLLRLMAEPAIAERDKKLRVELRRIAGKATGKKAQAILLMDELRNQRSIVNECGINAGDLSTLVKGLKEANLLSGDGKHPRLAISIPKDFFERGNGAEK